MQEIGIESTILKDILNGKKTIEGRLGKPQFLRIKVGDQLSLREDIWESGSIIKSQSNCAIIRVTQILYFESFEEMLSTLSYKSVIPAAKAIDDAVAIYHQFYSREDEFKYGVVAILFELE